MNRHFPTICSILLLVLAVSCDKPQRDLVIYTYDSFAGEYGAGPRLAALFQKETGIEITWRAKGDGGQLLADLSLEAGHPGADLVVGLDNLLAPRALAQDLLSPYAPKGLASIPKDLIVDPDNRLLPFDYGWFAIIYDSAKAKELPRSLEELATRLGPRQLILMDARSSTPGLGFVAWTKAVYGDRWEDYWKRLAPAVLAATPGWDAGYGLFLSGEAPFVLSYSTSPAYHRETEKSDRYRVLQLSEGAPREIELAGVLKGAPHRRNAERFMDFLLSREAQEILPLTQWMYPVLPGIDLPASYEAALKPMRTLAIDTAGLSADAIKAMELLAPK